MRKTRIMPVSYRTFPIHWLVEQYITFLGTEHTKKLSLSSQGKIRSPLSRLKFFN